MSNKKIGPIIDLGDGDEPETNFSNNRSFADVVEARMSRRTVLKGSLATAITGIFGGVALTGCDSSSSSGTGTGSAPQLLGFDAVPVSELDEVVVPSGYSTQVLAEWGRSISNPTILYDLPITGEQQGDAIGSHHDGMHFFPIEGTDPYEGSSEDGLLVMNHEYVEPRYMHASAIGQSLSRSAYPTYDDEGVVRRVADEVLAEMNAHGVTVVRVQKQLNGEWAVVADARNRRITALTPMEISGPVRGTDFVKTKYDPTGTMTRGTLNNCGHGVTPWNTYVAAEENWAGYFRTGAERPREQARYGVGTGAFSRYGWERADADPESNDEAYARFDVTPTGASALEDYRNEPNCFGWMVEIDPFDPDSTPVKRTALGRFAHEGVVFHPAVEGQPVVCYSGDDSGNQYIYKFVSGQSYFQATAGGHLLDNGTLYVAKFNDDGTGEWLPLVFGQGPLVAPLFNSQADVLVNTRLAADTVGATKMDRPEWGAVDPNTGEVYFTLTNNSGRTAENTDAANPRGPNRHGQIIRWREDGNNTSALSFTWDLFVLAGDTSEDAIVGGFDLNGDALTEDNIFSSPDGLWIDADSRLWIQTDMSESVVNTNPTYAMMGNNMMLAGNPFTGEIRRFFTGTLGQEITGVITTPDQTTMFINQQHPGATITAAEFASGDIAGLGNWPLGGNNYARSATVVITKDDGGVIGS
ncbi:protein of unknown function DUF839 [Thioalkalivibrio sulfidiphilus HL-EbGr7]|uniref:PhoX family phosphatase n=1 Tax=Thioalkalivibrio sulfidiphilus (strain HL-EbGR7) TaxID=396588 RepID=B8GU55_THISH|nr:PhoX family phosphatase [Thioalkalivibrio sulfidiphilus]ACL71338.1 protein of unknown function DUF839 [Thioalkalivibrio sulfidiphilus HL-EbGr7]